MLDGIAKSPADVTMETDFKYASTEITATVKGKSDHAMSKRALSCKSDVFIKSLSSSLRNLSMWKRRRNNIQSQRSRWTAPRKLSSRHSRPDTQTNSQRLEQHAQGLSRFKPDTISALRRGS